MTDNETMGTADQMPSETPAAATEADVVPGEAAEVSDVGSGVATVARVPWPQSKWRSAKQMRRSKLYRQHVAVMFTPEWQEEMVQKIADRLAPHYSAKREPDETLAAKLPGDRSYYDAMKRPANVVPLQRGYQVPLVDARGREDAKKFWTARLSLANAERLTAHQHLATLEAEINTCNDMLSQLRTNAPKPNGPDRAA